MNPSQIKLSIETAVEHLGASDRGKAILLALIDLRPHLIGLDAFNVSALITLLDNMPNYPQTAYDTIHRELDKHVPKRDFAQDFGVSSVAERIRAANDQKLKGIETIEAVKKSQWDAICEIHKLMDKAIEAYEETIHDSSDL